MSEADMMFEELGYEKWIDSRNVTHFIHKKKEKDFTFMDGTCYSIKRPTQKEQIAINMKCKELRIDMMGYCEYFKVDIDDYEELEKLREEYGEYCLQGCENCEWYEEE